MVDTPRTHTLKTWPVYFAQLWLGHKTCEVRKDDRGFRVGDTLILEEWDPDCEMGAGEEDGYSGRRIHALVTHLLDAGCVGPVLKDAVGNPYVVMSLRVTNHEED